MDQLKQKCFHFPPWNFSWQQNKWNHRFTLLTWHQGQLLVKHCYRKASGLSLLRAASAPRCNLLEMHTLRPTQNSWVWICIGTRDPGKLACTLKLEKPCASSSHLLGFSFDPLPYRVFLPGWVVLCVGQVGKWLLYRQNNMFITCPCCYFLLLTWDPSMPSLSHQTCWPDSQQTKRFSSLCDVSSSLH